MNTKELEPFDLKRAQAGDPVVTDDGDPFTFVEYKEGAAYPYPVIGWIFVDGAWYGESYEMSSLRMAPKKRKVWVYFSNKTWAQSDFQSTAEKLSNPGYPILEAEVPV